MATATPASHGSYSPFSGSSFSLNPAQFGDFGPSFPGAPHSPLLSSALVGAVADALSGIDLAFTTANPPRANPDPRSLDHLDLHPRSAVVDWELLAPFDIKTVVAQAADGLSGGDRVILRHRLEDGTPVPFCELVAPGTDVFQAQVKLVSEETTNREKAADQINVQLTDLLNFFTGSLYMHPARNRYMLEFIRAALRFCVLTVFRIKHSFTCPRPAAFKPSIMPMIQTPSHSSLPSGHATEAYFLATLFKEFFKLSGAGGAGPDDNYGKQCELLAHNIAHNRTIAGVHFPVDNAAGALLGTSLANYVLARMMRPAGAASGLEHWLCDMTVYGGAEFRKHDYRRIINDGKPASLNDKVLTDIPVAANTDGVHIKTSILQKSSQLTWLWDQCLTEIRQNGY